MKRSYDFSPDQVEAIDRLSTELNIGKLDVLQNGLRLMRIAVREARRGRTIAVVGGEVVLSELVGPWSDVTEAGAA